MPRLLDIICATGYIVFKIYLAIYSCDSCVQFVPKHFEN